MSVSMYMGIGDPLIGNGDSKDSTATFKITTLSFSGVAPVNASGNAVGNASLGPVTVTLPAVQLPALLESLVEHTTHTINIDIFKVAATGEAGVVFESYTLTEALLTLFQETATAGDAAPMLELSFSYKSIKFMEQGGLLVFTYDVDGKLP